jgi:hypothetical protein
MAESFDEFLLREDLAALTISDLSWQADANK